jgi:hypothetical protein
LIIAFAAAIPFFMCVKPCCGGGGHHEEHGNQVQEEVEMNRGNMDIQGKDNSGSLEDDKSQRVEVDMSGRRKQMEVLAKKLKALEPAAEEHGFA